MFSTEDNTGTGCLASSMLFSRYVDEVMLEQLVGRKLDVNQMLYADDEAEASVWVTKTA